MKSTIDKLTYRFHRLGFYFYSVKFSYQQNNKKENRIKCLLKSIINNLKIFNTKYGYYEYLEIPITTKCSLRCKNCSNIIPYYTNRFDYDIDVLLKSIKEFLKLINNIVYIRVLGGEPFLSDNLYKVVNFLIKSNKIQKIEIVTNGTIIPKDKKLIELLKNKKITVSISKYPIVNQNTLIEFLQNNNINYRIDNMKYWMDYGKPKKRNKTEKELKKQFSRCNSVCKSLVNGQFHLCPRSSHGTDLGILTNNEEDYLDLLDNTLSTKEKKERLNKLLKKEYIMACDYCIFGTKECKKIPVAEQIKDKKNNKSTRKN